MGSFSWGFLGVERRVEVFEVEGRVRLATVDGTDDTAQLRLPFVLCGEYTSSRDSFLGVSRLTCRAWETPVDVRTGGASLPGCSFVGAAVDVSELLVWGLGERISLEIPSAAAANREPRLLLLLLFRPDKLVGEVPCPRFIFVRTTALA